MIKNILKVIGLSLTAIFFAVGVIFFTGTPELPLGVPFNQQDLIDAIPSNFQIGDEDTAFAWTDDNTDEDIIIRTDSRNYHSWGSAVIMHVSITNVHKFDQNVGLVFSFPDARYVAEKYMRFTGNSSTTSQVVTALPKDPHGVPTFETVEHLEAQYQELVLTGVDTRDISSISRKDIKANLTQNNVAVLNIASGETAIFKVYVKFPKGVEGQEYFLEAFGDRGAYGHLDPNSWDFEDDFEAYGTGFLTGNGDWTETSNTYDVVSSPVYEGTRGVECPEVCNKAANANFTDISDDGAEVWWAFMNDNGMPASGDSTFRVMEGGGNRVLVGVHSGTIKWGHGSPTGGLDTIISAVSGRWYIANVQMADDGTHRVRIYDTVTEVWSSWTSWDTGYYISTSGDFTSLNLNTGGTGDAHYDLITATDPLAAGGAPAGWEDVIIISKN